MATILNSAILDSAILIQPFCTKLWLKSSSIWLKLIHSDSTWWWQSSWILAILDSAQKKLHSLISFGSHPLKLTHTCQDWFPLFSHSKKIHSFNLTELDDGNHLEFCHLGYSHLHKKTSLLHSHSNWWLQPSWILLSWIQPFCTKKKKLHLFILTELDDGSHLELCHLVFRHCHLGFRHLVIFSQIHLNNTLTPFWLWLKLIQSDSNSFILT